MSDRAPTKAEVHQAVQTLLAYGTHGTAPDPSSAPQQPPPPAPTGQGSGKRK